MPTLSVLVCHWLTLDISKLDLKHSLQLLTLPKGKADLCHQLKSTSVIDWSTCSNDVSEIQINQYYHGETNVILLQGTRKNETCRVHCLISLDSQTRVYMELYQSTSCCFVLIHGHLFSPLILIWYCYATQYPHYIPHRQASFKSSAPLCTNTKKPGVYYTLSLTLWQYPLKNMLSARSRTISVTSARSSHMPVTSARSSHMSVTSARSSHMPMTSARSKINQYSPILLYYGSGHWA